jgi:hypothetical protein
LFLIFTLILFIAGCDKELTEKDINVRVVNDTTCKLHIYENSEFRMTLEPSTGKNFDFITEGNKHLEAKRDGDLKLVQDTYVELHVGDEFNWVVNTNCEGD